MIRCQESQEDVVMAAGPVERRRGNVSFFDYTPDTVAPPPGPAWYGLIVSGAEIRNPAGGASCGVLFLLSRRDHEVTRAVSLPRAIERANRAREDIVARMMPGPAWGMNAVYRWDGSFLGLQRQTA